MRLRRQLDWQIDQNLYRRLSAAFFNLEFFTRLELRMHTGGGLRSQLELQIVGKLTTDLRRCL